MFTFPRIEDVISIFIPVGEYRTEWSSRNRKTVVRKDLVAARLEAFNTVVGQLFAGAGEAAFLAAAIFVGIRCLHWLPF